MDKLSKKDLEGYRDLTTWIVVSDGEGVQSFNTREEAIEEAKGQAADTPGLVLGLYKIDRYICARVLPPQLFGAPTEDTP